jgi:hypothetical protein
MLPPTTKTFNLTLSEQKIDTMELCHNVAKSAFSFPEEPKTQTKAIHLMTLSLRRLKHIQQRNRLIYLAIFEDENP